MSRWDAMQAALIAYEDDWDSAWQQQLQNDPEYEQWIDGLENTTQQSSCTNEGENQ